MHDTIQMLHSYWAYIVFLILTIATVNAIIKSIFNKAYTAVDFRLALFALIVSHIQLLIGLLLYFLSDRLHALESVGEVMRNPSLRLYLVEHPLINIIAVILITMGYSKHKKKLTSGTKLKTIAIFYTIALILLLSRVPWSAWLS